MYTDGVEWQWLPAPTNVLVNVLRHLLLLLYKYLRCTRNVVCYLLPEYPLRR